MMLLKGRRRHGGTHLREPVDGEEDAGRQVLDHLHPPTITTTSHGSASVEAFCSHCEPLCVVCGAEDCCCSYRRVLEVGVERGHVHGAGGRAQEADDQLEPERHLAPAHLHPRHAP